MNLHTKETAGCASFVQYVPIARSLHTATRWTEKTGNQVWYSLFCGEWAAFLQQVPKTLWTWSTTWGRTLEALTYIEMLARTSFSPCPRYTRNIYHTIKLWRHHQMTILKRSVERVNRMTKKILMRHKPSSHWMTGMNGYKTMTNPFTCAVDGFSGKNVGFVTMPVNNNVEIYTHLFR